MSDVTRRLLPAAAMLLLVGLPAAGQVPQRGLPGRTMLDRFGLERAWSNQATIDVRSDVVRHLVADEEVVIVQSRSGIVTVFDAQSGVKLWDGLLASPEQYSFPAVTNGENLFIAIGSTVYARDKFTGVELWTLRLPSVPSTSPTVDEARMYVGSLNGSVYAFDLEVIAENQAEGLLPQYNYENIVWRHATSSQIETSPVTNGKIVVFANAAGSLYAVSASDRDLVYQIETDSATTAPLELLGDDLFYASGDTNFYCFNAPTGTTNWVYVAGSTIRDKPRMIGGSVYLVPVGAGMYDLAVDTGRARWWASMVTQFLAATPTRAYGSADGGNIAVLDRANGALLGTLPMSNFPVRVSNERTDRIYASSTSGLVTCLRERGAEIPIYHRFPERRPILPLFDDRQPEGEPTDAAGATPEERDQLEDAAEALPETAD